jgi:hypothetical protein
MGPLIGVKYCILDPPLLMFVRLLVLLISNYFSVYSVLCYVGHCNKTWLAKGKVDLKEKKLIPAKCVRPHLVRSNALTVARRSRGRTRGQPALTVICVRTQGSAVERTPSQP